MRDRSVLSRSTSRYCHLAGSVERFAPSYYFLTQHTSTYPHEERFARNITLALTRKIQSFRNFGRPTLLCFSQNTYISTYPHDQNLRVLGRITLKLLVERILPKLLIKTYILSPARSFGRKDHKRLVPTGLLSFVPKRGSRAAGAY